MKVHKHKIDMGGVFELDVGRIVHVGTSPQGDPSVWAQTSNHSVRQFTVLMTGQELDARFYCHAGTFMHNALVCHLYEIFER